MPRFRLVLLPGSEGIGRQMEVDAPTPWLALENTPSLRDAPGAEIYLGRKCLGRVSRQVSGRHSFWLITQPGPARTREAGPAASPRSL